MKFRIEAPDLRASLAGVEEKIAASVSAAMRAATDGLKGDLRADVVAAGLGTRLANTWRGKTYPIGRNSADAASYVYSSASKIAFAFSQGVTIRSQHGRFLAIPTEYAGTLPGGRKFTPSTWEQRKGVKLQYVRTKAGQNLLVANLRVRSGKSALKNSTKYAAPSKSTRKNKLESVVIFNLVPQVTLRKLLNINATAQRWADKVPGLLAENWKD